jgi:hypothetical protein
MKKIGEIVRDGRIFGLSVMAAGALGGFAVVEATQQETKVIKSPLGGYEGIQVAGGQISFLNNGSVAIETVAALKLSGSDVTQLCEGDALLSIRGDDENHALDKIVKRLDDSSCIDGHGHLRPGTYDLADAKFLP